MTACQHPASALIPVLDGYRKRVETCGICSEVTYREPDRPEHVTDDLGTAVVAACRAVHCDWCTHVITGMFYMSEDQVGWALDLGDAPLKYCRPSCVQSAARWAVSHRG